ncbi:MAG: rhamnan synthesis F family protein, partial [Clostridiales Family XIII bacterium]|nr:rhamnan synthesis F family protein [Clostridiales Family XIII bacterium]
MRLESPKRVAIFVFYDNDGIVDRCVEVFLKGLNLHLQRLVIVVNGEIDFQARALLSQYTNEIIIRKNEGFDVWGWKTGIDYLGRDAIREYDELILVNDTMFGPFYPLSELFDSMSPKGFDFWGITAYPEDRELYSFAAKNPYKYVPTHIQSYFTVFCKTLLISEDFYRY